MGVADDFAPSFTQKPQLRQEDDGNKLIFECQLVGSPKPEISWFRGETELREDDRTNFKMQSVGTNKFLVVLELDDVIESDAGLYKVKAKNKMGEVAASINLNFSRKSRTVSLRTPRRARAFCSKVYFYPTSRTARAALRRRPFYDSLARSKIHLSILEVDN